MGRFFCFAGSKEIPVSFLLSFISKQSCSDFPYSSDIPQVDLSVNRFEGAEDRAIFKCMTFPAPCGLLLPAASANCARWRPAPLATGAGAAHCVPRLQDFVAGFLLCKRSHLNGVEFGQSFGPFLEVHFTEFVQQAQRLVSDIVPAQKTTAAIQSAIADFIRTCHRQQAPSSFFCFQRVGR